MASSNQNQTSRKQQSSTWTTLSLWLPSARTLINNRGDDIMKLKARKEWSHPNSTEKLEENGAPEESIEETPHYEYTLDFEKEFDRTRKDGVKVPKKSLGGDYGKDRITVWENNFPRCTKNGKQYPVDVSVKECHLRFVDSQLQDLLGASTDEFVGTFVSEEVPDDEEGENTYRDVTEDLHQEKGLNHQGFNYKNLNLHELSGFETGATHYKWGGIKDTRPSNPNNTVPRILFNNHFTDEEAIIKTYYAGEEDIAKTI